MVLVCKKDMFLRYELSNVPWGVPEAKLSKPVTCSILPQACKTASSSYQSLFTSSRKRRIPRNVLHPLQR